MEKLYLCGGCFWCIESVYAGIDGVKSVVSGYSGGDVINPTYEEVKAQNTKHREALEIVFDENKITLETLIDIYLDSVEPFNNEGQYIDTGFSYTLALMYLNESQKNIIEKKINEFEKIKGQKTCIEVLPFKNFYKAEEYHQEYYLKNPKEFKNEIKESNRRENFDYNLLNNQLKSLIEDDDYDISILSNASALLFSSLKDLNWAGFYIIKDNQLKVGPFQGNVACSTIQIGKGVCGTAVKESKTIVVENVHEFPGHIACDENSKSEIVIPIYKDNRIYGVLDIDSPIYNRFLTVDKLGLEEFVRIIERKI